MKKNYFDKDSEKFISEQIVKNKYAYLVENFDEEFEKNIKNSLLIQMDIFVMTIKMFVYFSQKLIIFILPLTKKR